MDKEAFSNAVSVVSEYYGTHEYSKGRIRDITRALKLMVRCMESTPLPESLEAVRKAIIADSNNPDYLKRDVKHLVPMLDMAMKTGSTESRPISTREPLYLAPKLAAVFSEYSDYLHKIHTNDNTIGFAIRSSEQFLTYLTKSGITELSKLEGHQIDSFVSTGMKGFKSSTKKAVICRVRKLLHYLYLHGYISPVLGIWLDDVKIIIPQQIVTVLPDKYVDEIVNCEVEGSEILTRDKAIALCAEILAVRKSDILNLKMEDIDWDNMMISFTQQKTKSYHKIHRKRNLRSMI